MKNKILKYIYRRYSARFNDYLVEDYLQSIPNDVYDPALDLMMSHRSKFKKLTNFLAFQLHRRMATDPTNSERYQGMFIQMKIFDSMIGAKVEPKQEKEYNEENVKVDKEYQTYVQGIEAFTKGNPQ